MTTTDSSGRMAGSNNDTASFNYGQDGAFPSIGENPPLVCRSTGALERQIVITAQKAAGKRQQEAREQAPWPRNRALLRVLKLQPDSRAFHLA